MSPCLHILENKPSRCFCSCCLVVFALFSPFGICLSCCAHDTPSVCSLGQFRHKFFCFYCLISFPIPSCKFLLSFTYFLFFLLGLILLILLVCHVLVSCLHHQSLTLSRFDTIQPFLVGSVEPKVSTPNSVLYCMDK